MNDMVTKTNTTCYFCDALYIFCTVSVLNANDVNQSKFGQILGRAQNT